MLKKFLICAFGLGLCSVVYAGSAQDFSAEDLAGELGEIVMDLDGKAYAGLGKIRIFFDANAGTGDPKLAKIEIDSRHQGRFKCDGSVVVDSGPPLIIDGIQFDIDVNATELIFAPGFAFFVTSRDFAAEGVECEPEADVVFRDKLECVLGDPEHPQACDNI